MRGKGLHRSVVSDWRGLGSAQKLQQVNILGIMGAKFLTVREVLYMHGEREREKDLELRDWNRKYRYERTVLKHICADRY